MPKQDKIKEFNEQFNQARIPDDLIDFWLRTLIKQTRQEAKEEVIKQVANFFGLTENDLPAFPDKDFNLLDFILSVGKRNWYQIAYTDARVELLEEIKKGFNESNLKRWGNNGWEIILEGLKNK